MYLYMVLTYINQHDALPTYLCPQALALKCTKLVLTDGDKYMYAIIDQSLQSVDTLLRNARLGSFSYLYDTSFNVGLPLRYNCGIEKHERKDPFGLLFDSGDRDVSDNDSMKNSKLEVRREDQIEDQVGLYNYESGESLFKIQKAMDINGTRSM